MMTELEISQAIMTALQDACPDLAVEAFPTDLDKYELGHPVGALLVMSLGRVEDYPYKSNQMETVNFGHISTGIGRWGILIALRDIRTFDRIYEVTDAVKSALTELVIDDFRLYFSSYDEPVYEEDRQIVFRALEFIHPTIAEC